MDTVTAPCSHCFRETHQNVLHSITQELDDGVSAEVYKLLECAGCHNICMANYSFYDDEFRECYRKRYYPPPAKRKVPSWRWLGESLPHKIAVLLDEIYEAERGGQCRLAAMGIRAVLEQLMISKVGDHGTFEKNVNAFREQGYSSLVERDQLHAILEAGHATMHRGFNPTEGEVSMGLDIVEGILSTIYANGEAAASLADRIPPRRPRPKSP